MTLSFYVARRFLRSFLVVFATFWGILFLIGLVDEVHRVSKSEGPFTEALILSALNVPATLYTILPLVMLLSAVVLFLGLARSSELVVMRASGRSALRIILAPMVVAALLGGLAVTVGNPLVSATANRYEEKRSDMRDARRDTVSIGRNGVWMRQSATYTNSQGETRNGQAVIHAARGNRDATELYEVSFLVLSPSGSPVRRIDADRAILQPGQWQLFAAKDWPLGQSTNPERDASLASMLTVPSNLTARAIRDSFGEPSSVPVWNLPEFINAMEEAGFSATRHRVWLNMEIALPALMVAMVMLAAAFTMRHTRFGGTGIRVLLALGAGLAVFFLRNITQVLGDNGQVPVMLAAWAPPLIALSLALALLLHLEDG
ncbi:LPS export ABC transporter permease LptG [Rhodobacteraceae bacterium]|nr:LPS export ABC transporter permease LptG [Paracoccaceae bacterium]